MRTAAEEAAGSALLQHVSPNGGSSSAEIDLARAADVARTITGPQLYDLLAHAAQLGARSAERAADLYRERFLEEAKAVAETADSLALHRFIEQYESEATVVVREPHAGEESERH